MPECSEPCSCIHIQRLTFWEFCVCCCACAHFCSHPAFNIYVSNGSSLFNDDSSSLSSNYFKMIFKLRNIRPSNLLIHNKCIQAEFNRNRRRPRDGKMKKKCESFLAMLDFLYGTSTFQSAYHNQITITYLDVKTD